MHRVSSGQVLWRLQYIFLSLGFHSLYRMCNFGFLHVKAVPMFCCTIQLPYWERKRWKGGTCGAVQLKWLRRVGGKDVMPDFIQYVWLFWYLSWGCYVCSWNQLQPEIPPKPYHQCWLNWSPSKHLHLLSLHEESHWKQTPLQLNRGDRHKLS
jgi:hypothetical protein